MKHPASFPTKGWTPLTDTVGKRRVRQTGVSVRLYLRWSLTLLLNLKWPAVGRCGTQGHIIRSGHGLIVACDV